MESEAPSKSPLEAYNRIVQILGCKWSLAILDAIDRGIVRPGRIEKELSGISPKVLHQCMNRLSRDRIIEKSIYPEVPPRVEYKITSMGQHFLALINNARAIAQDWQGTGPYMEE